jgi:ArsR family transcriptional regulator
MDIATGPDLIEETAEKLRILSVETRLRMLALLAERNLCVGALACQLGVSQGAVSQHLKILRDAGLVTAERDGYFVHYRVDRQAVARWQREIDGMLNHLQKGKTHVAVPDEATGTHCKRQKEEACARRESQQPVVGRATT